MANVVLGTKISKMLEYQQLLKQDKYQNDWTHSSENKFEQLEQGIGRHIKNRMNTAIIKILIRCEIKPVPGWDEVHYSTSVLMEISTVVQSQCLCV